MALGLYGPGILPVADPRRGGGGVKGVNTPLEVFFCLSESENSRGLGP